MLRRRQLRQPPFRRTLLLCLAVLLLPALRASADPPPNFVVFLTDDQRFDTLWAMPIVQQELVSRGVLFDDAIGSTPLCCPFRASFLSGGYLAHRTGVVDNAPPNGGAPGFRDGDTMITRLQQAGYATALFGKYMNQYSQIAPYIPPGWAAFEAALGTMLTSSYSLAIGSSGATPSVGTIVSRRQYGTDYVRDRTLDFIQSHAGQPFFVMLSMDAPHSPAIPPPSDAGLFPGYLYRDRGYAEADLSDKPLRVQIIAAQFPTIAAQEDQFHLDQLRTLPAVDRAVGAVVDRLQQLSLLDNTVIVFTSDNGYLWGEHGMVGKQEIYEESLRLPLVVVAPGAVPGTDSHQVAANLDLPATIEELAGLPATGDGRSLVPLLQGANPPWRGTQLIESWTMTQSWAGLRIDDARGRWKYVENTRSYAELYDLANDPFELQNLANQPSMATFVAQLSAELAPQKGLASTTHSAPSGKVGVAYSRPLGAWGGRPPYTWTLYQGSLPPGILLNPAGALSGNPTAVGSWDLTVQVADTSTDTVTGGPQVYRQRLQIKITADCADGVDNDGDGLVDFVGGDPGCVSDSDPSERSPSLACDDGLDNDGDGKIDFVRDANGDGISDAPGDPGCRSPSASRENPQCSDGVNNDPGQDALIDWDGGASAGVPPASRTAPDPECGAPWGNREAAPSRCGLGFELALLLPLLARLGSLRRRRG